jgi:hypothetical protein
MRKKLGKKVLNTLCIKKKQAVARQRAHGTNRLSKSYCIYIYYNTNTLYVIYKKIFE